ncbi:MAG: response regulator transcription factor [Actinobacteria bacterium]|nr:MAG: response regulator transcription factor [Actinomycetota bacterium]
MPIRVLIADPQPLFCEALADGLRRWGGFDVVGWTTDEREADRRADSCDIVLSETDLAPGSGFSLARRAGGRRAIVILTRRPVGEVLLDAVAAGAMGCVGHDTGLAGLVRLVSQAAGGTFTVDPAALRDALQRVRASRDGVGAIAPALASLSAREREVLRLLARGLSNEAIGNELYLSAHTVRTHVAKILKKLGAHSRADAARAAVKAGEADSDVRVLRFEGPDLKRV